MNKRKDIRDALKALLEAHYNGVTHTVTILSSRKGGISQGEQMPSINIVTPNEDKTPESMNRRRYIRKTQILFEVRLEADASIDDDLDTFMSELEQLLTTNSNFGGTVLDSVMLSEETDVGYEGDTEIGLGILVCEATYIA